MSIVWAWAGSIAEYVAAGQQVVALVPSCPSCSRQLGVESPDVWAFEKAVDTNGHRMVSIGIVEITKRENQNRWPRI